MNSSAPPLPKIAPLDFAFRSGVQEKLRGAIVAHGLDGALFLSPANVLYTCGFNFSVNERPVGLFVPAVGKPVLFVPLLELENAEPVEGVVIKIYDEFPGHEHPVLWMARESLAKKLAVDGLDARLLAPLEAMLDKVVLEDLVAPARFIKCEAEFALTRVAASYADLCLQRLLDEGGNIIAQGGTELDLLAECTSFALSALKRDHGEAFAGTKLGISASVHSGPLAALPHGATSRRQPLFGDTLIAGIGCSLGGYHAESGITLIVGEMSAEQRRIMKAMEDCDTATARALRPGTACEAVNEAALGALRNAGLGDAIRHRIGHGMGLEGHEAPWLAPGDTTQVRPGMIFSSEPGVYRPGRDGYRTINTMIVHAGGVEIPSRFQADHPIDNRVIAL
ncbi:Xaa-Pro peptidase family protein [Hoeflea sp. 108]|uniref:M24 family metallopeptidase n=1 Tax=Hoeflea sp. 108 TaxID=1116369 RepID=UPI00037EA19D|nr:Xaa-Pro peptidase family protein [Hoeflea sp. 108]